MNARRESDCFVIDRRANGRFIDAFADTIVAREAVPVNEAAADAFVTEYELLLENIMARADKGMGGGVAGNRAGPDGTQAPGKDVGDGENIISESDLANRKMGDAGQQGTDPDRLSNERDTAVDTAPGGKPQPDADPIESFRKMDKDVRAAEDLGKGNRDGGDPNPDGPDSLVDEMSDPKDADSSLAARNGI